MHMPESLKVIKLGQRENINREIKLSRGKVSR